MKFKMIPIMFLLLLVTSIYINVTSASTKVPDELPIAKVSPRGSTKLRENYTIEITLTNPNEEDKVDIWKCWAEIDTEKIPEEELQYIEIIKGREEITNFESGDEVTLELIIKFKDDAPEGEYVIPLRVSGKWIVCSSGCVPFQPQNVETKVTLTVLKPVITVYLEDEFSVKGGGKLEIPFSIKNIGTAKALNMSVNYVVDDELLEDLESPSISQELNASAIVDEKLYLDTENIAYGDYSLAIHVEYFTIKNERKVFDKRCDIHILGPTEEEINQEKLDRASTREREAGTFLSKDEFDSALEKYKEAKALYEETGIATKVDDMNNKIITVAETIQKIQKDTERADQEFQNGNQYMDGGDYARALEKITVAKTLYTNLFNLTKSNESYRGLYESKITECEEKIQNLQEKIDEDKEKNVELPKIQAVFVVAIALLLASLVFGIILIRKE